MVVIDLSVKLFYEPMLAVYYIYEADAVVKSTKQPAVI